MGLRAGTIGAEIWYGENFGATFWGRDERRFTVLRYGQGDGKPSMPNSGYTSGKPMIQGVEYLAVEQWTHFADPDEYQKHYGRRPIQSGTTVTGADLHWSSLDSQGVMPKSVYHNLNFWRFLLTKTSSVDIDRDEQFVFPFGEAYLPKDVLLSNNRYIKVADIQPEQVNDFGGEFGKGPVALALMKVLSKLA